MNYTVLNWLTGYDRYRMDGVSGEKTAQRLLEANVPFWDLRFGAEGEVCFCVSSLLRRRIHLLFSDAWDGVRVELFGFPRFLWRYRRRWGVFAGVMLFGIFLNFASSHVWQVRVADRETDEDLKQKLASAGLWEGIASREFDNSRFAVAFLAENPQYSFVSAGIHGGVAWVWLHDRKDPPSMERPTGAANLIACEQGEILRCEAAYGQVEVAFGDCVQKGQLLVSGVVEAPGGGYRLENASGRVLAKVEKSLEVEIPYVCEKKVYTGEEKTVTGLRILGKNINFFDFYGKNPQLCDTIDTVEDFAPLPWLQLPFFRVKRSYAPYRMETLTRTPQQAIRLAYDEYHRILNDELMAEEVLEERVDVKQGENGVTLCASLTLVMDIAQKQEITLGELVQPSPEKG